MYKLREEKNELRIKFLGMRAAIDSAEKRSRDERIQKLFVSLVSYRYAETLLLYYPKKTEINTLPIIEAALAAGKRVALPVCTKALSMMDYRYITSADDLEEGAYRIPAPKPSCELFDKAGCRDNVLAVIPALAFDKRGFRLGYGKGYYDRYTEGLCASCVGLVYSDFIVDRLPTGRHDMSVGLLVTEKGVRLIGQNS